MDCQAVVTIQMMRRGGGLAMKDYRKERGLLIILFCALLVLFLHAGAFSEKNEPVITVGVPVDRCPVFYLDEDHGEVIGIGVDLMRMAAKKAGYTATFTAIQEGTLKEALDNEAYDVLMPFGSAISSTSGHSSIVSENLTLTPFTLVSESDGTLPRLNDLRVGMLQSLGGAAETVRQMYSGIEIIMFRNMSECVKALRTGKVDALLHNSYVWSYVLQKPAYSDLAVQPSAMFSMDFRAGALDTPKGREIIGRLNDGIAELTDTFRQAVVLDYTTRRLYRYDLLDYLHQYGLVILLAVLVVFFLIMIMLTRQRALRLEQEKKMLEMIDHDPLTGVLSLNGFRKKAAELLRENLDIPYLLVYVNIKDFKYINDSLGMKAGDELLRFWTTRTLETLSENEALCRIADDHLAILRQSRGEEQVKSDDHRVIDSVRNYFIERGRENRVRVCGGIYVLTPEDYIRANVDRMLDFARAAEKRVRESRKDGYEFYNPEEWEKGKKTTFIVSHLSSALRSGEIQVWYQPQVDYDTGAITGAEALCRWNHPTQGWIVPSDFIPILEDAGLIYDLDSFVWERVCQDLHRWNEQGDHLSVSVNLSRQDIQNGRNIPGQFHELVSKHGLSANQIGIEITESAYVEDPEQLIRTTIRLRELGIRVEMDDFGSGYSSLHMLKEVPVDRIKLDLHFLTGTGDLEKGRIIVSQVIQMVRQLGMSLIVEGVEYESQEMFLQSRGCSEIQGFLFYRPMPVGKFEEIFRTKKSGQAQQNAELDGGESG